MSWRSLRTAVRSTQVRYLFTGAWNTLFGLVAFTALWLLLQDRIPYGWVLLLAQLVAVAQAHWAQRRFTWSSRGAYLPEFLRFGAVYGAVYFVNLGLLALAVEVFTWPVLPCQVVIGGLLVVASYGVNGAWTFKHRARRDGGGAVDASQARTPAAATPDPGEEEGSR